MEAVRLYPVWFERLLFHPGLGGWLPEGRRRSTATVFAEPVSSSSRTWTGLRGTEVSAARWDSSPLEAAAAEVRKMRLLEQTCGSPSRCRGRSGAV